MSSQVAEESVFVKGILNTDTNFKSSKWEVYFKQV